VPISGVSFEECIQLSKEVAQRVGEELAIPVYLYEKSAQRPQRRNLADVRRGEYESLEAKLKLPEWRPDFGPAKFNAKAGATVIGARGLLIAFNINLNTREVQYAMDIALELRTKGRSARRGNTVPVYLRGEEILKYREGCYPCGKDDFVGNTLQQTVEHCWTEHRYDLVELLKLHGIDPEKPEGESVKIPGRFACCKAFGWFVEEYDRAQVSFNLTNFKVTSMHEVLEETRRLASERGLAVTGSEIVGMVPYEALLASGRYHLKREGCSASTTISDILSAGVEFLGLNELAQFRIEERVLGWPEQF
jgi:glutamate formiminotransferase/formiminotetrahydrofolate cyclodeaminase